MLLLILVVGFFLQLDSYLGWKESGTNPFINSFTYSVSLAHQKHG